MYKDAVAGVVENSVIHSCNRLAVTNTCPELTEQEVYELGDQGFSGGYGFVNFLEGHTIRYKRVVYIIPKTKVVDERKGELVADYTIHEVCTYNRVVIHNKKVSN